MRKITVDKICLLYTSDAADEEDSVDLGGRCIINKKKKDKISYAVLAKRELHTTISTVTTN